MNKTISELHSMEEKLKVCLDTLKLISKVGNSLPHIESESRIYTLDSDEFGSVMFMRDLADIAIREVNLLNREQHIKSRIMYQ